MGNYPKSLKQALELSDVKFTKKKLVCQSGEKVKLADIEMVDVMADPRYPNRRGTAWFLIGFAAVVCYMYLFPAPGGGMWVNPAEWSSRGRWIGSSKVLIWAPLAAGLGLLAWSRLAVKPQLVVYRPPELLYPFEPMFALEKIGAKVDRIFGTQLQWGRERSSILETYVIAQVQDEKMAHELRRAVEQGLTDPRRSEAMPAAAAPSASEETVPKGAEPIDAVND